MKLTIVVTTYNQEKYIGEAIEGFLKQKTNFDYKIVISNDASTDGTRKILNEYKEKYPTKFEIIENKQNLGAMKNFINTLAQIKDTEYVALCDGDDFWTDENKLQKQVDFLDANPDFNICCHYAKVFYQNNEKGEQIIPNDVEDITTLEDLVKQNYIVANSVVYRWKFNNMDLKEVFPTDIVPGDYYVHLLHAQDGKIKTIKEVMSAYRRHSEGMWWSCENEEKEKFISKYGRKFLNFYNAADKYMKLPENSFYAQRKDIIYNIIVVYTKLGNSLKIQDEIISQKDKELYQEAMQDIVNRNLWFIDYIIQKDKEEKEKEHNQTVCSDSKINNIKLISFFRKVKKKLMTIIRNKNSNNK